MAIGKARIGRGASYNSKRFGNPPMGEDTHADVNIPTHTNRKRLVFLRTIAVHFFVVQPSAAGNLFCISHQSVSVHVGWMLQLGLGTFGSVLRMSAVGRVWNAVSALVALPILSGARLRAVARGATPSTHVKL